MSIDLDWAQLDADLSRKAQQAINAALQSAPKPAFLGDIACTSFSFGRIGPQLEIVEIGEVWDEFLNVEDDDDDDDEEQDYIGEDDDAGEDYDTRSHHDEPWSGLPSIRPDLRRASTVSGTSSTAAPAAYAGARAQATSPTLSLGGWSGTGSLGMSAARPLHTPSLFTSNAGLWLHQQQQQHHRPSIPSIGGGGSSANTNLGYPFPRLNYGNNPFNNNNNGKHAHGQAYSNARRQRQDSPFTRDSALAPSAAAAAADDAAARAAPHDPLSSLSVQLHLRVRYRGTMHVRLSTSLRVNYPSLGFMALPLSLQITSLAFEGLLVVAYEGGHGTGGSGHRQRIHVSLLDEQEDEVNANTNGHVENIGRGRAKGSAPPLDRARTVRGAQLLKHVRVESEVGQRDKLVLKDVESVENFVLEMARKALEDEIAWPNFQSFAWT